jgi:hypothetical protein
MPSSKQVRKLSRDELGESGGGSLEASSTSEESASVSGVTPASSKVLFF